MAQHVAGDITRRPAHVDVVVVGAGFSGLYLLHRLRQRGFSTRVIEAADDVGGTWYWNRYPGARCDVPTTDYCYGFDAELEKAWTWSEKYATQPEILRYAQFVADRYDLKRDIDFRTHVASARWDDSAGRWRLRTEAGEDISCQHFVMASGCLSLPKSPEIEGADRFKGEVYVTSRWPHQGVDFTGKRVAVVGTGSSGIQSIPIIAGQAQQLTVFQRTPNFSIPAGNGPVRPERRAPLDTDRQGYRTAAKWSRIGVPREPTEVMGRFSTPQVQRERFEAAWQAGELVAIGGVFADQIVFPEANQIVAEMVREKIRATVENPQVAELLCPRDHPIGTKRSCVDTGYYATFNQPHVRLVDLRSQPIATITETGIDLAGESLAFDAIVYATGFDAMTGALVAVDIVGRCHDGVIRRMQPDVAMVLARMAAMGLPTVDSLPVDEARAFVQQLSAARPPGPVVGEVVDGMLPGAAGPLAYRLYRPASPGPHPLVVYFHGGGWVLGSHDSDDPLCRDLCQRSNALIASVNYRHAPEARFPAAADDGLAAVRWLADHAGELGGIPGALAVAGWSAGANIAAVTCQQARDAGGPQISGQLLLAPVTDADMTRPSYVENAEGYVLTAALMRWFWNHYADPADRRQPKASPLRATDLSNLPSAFIVTSQFDPLRDEGIAYAQAMAAAGVPVRHITARGHTHNSLTMVDVVVSGASLRAEMGEALRGFGAAARPLLESEGVILY